MTSRCLTGLLLAAALSSALAVPASADDVADFYRGKRINLVVGYGTGSGYDLYARILGRFMGDHTPGKPTIIAQNMPGAGSRGAANWLYKVAPKDGSVIAILSQTTPTDQALGQPGVQFDVRKFNWIGNMVVVNNLLFVSAKSRAATLEQAKSKQLAIGATGASSPSVLYPQVSNNLFGTKFKIVSGYASGTDINLAVERGEVDGRGSDSWASMKTTHSDWLRDHKINILVQVGLDPNPELTKLGAPELWKFISNNDDRKVSEMVVSQQIFQRSYVAPPGTPAEQIATLRTAFDATMSDPQFLADADAVRIAITPLSGAKVQEIVQKLYATPKAIIERARQAIKP